jgi:hydrogenase expression/formation protein HypE
MKTITLAHGSGGVESSKLINDIFFEAFGNEYLAQSEDASKLGEIKNIAMTTDSYIVSPIFFAGGDIGKIAVCGSCNDLAVSGARPKYLSVGFIIEEGFSLDELKKIVSSMAIELKINGANIITGDTKVAPRGSVDKVYINTTAIGEVVNDNLSHKNLANGDTIIVSGSIGEHGSAIFCAREGIDMTSNLKSDCRSLWPIIEELLSNGEKIVCMRDATRGGVAAVLNEWANGANVCITCEEAKIPLKDEVKGVCELLGFDALNLANEGRFVLALRGSSEKTMQILKKYEISASVIGIVGGEHKKKVILNSEYGTQRFMDYPSGELLPRIC